MKTKGMIMPLLAKTEKVVTFLGFATLLLWLMVVTTGCEATMNNFYRNTVSLLMRILVYGGVLVLIGISIKSAYEALQERQVSLVEGLMRAFTVLALIAIGIVAPSIIDFVIGSVGAIDVSPPNVNFGGQ